MPFSRRIDPAGQTGQTIGRILTGVSRTLGSQAEGFTQEQPPITTWGARYVFASGAMAYADSGLYFDATGGAITFDLLPAAEVKGRVFGLKKIDGTANAVTIDPAGGELIDGSAARTITLQNESVLIHSDGAGWRVYATAGALAAVVGVHTHQTNPQGGTLDHGLALTGLGDDDHTQYASAEGSGTRRAYEAGRLNLSVIAGAGLGGGGLLTSSVTLTLASHTHQSSGTAGGTLDHGLALTGLGDDDHSYYAHSEASGGTRRAYEAGRLTKSVTSGAGLTGGGTLNANVTLDVGAGAGITVNANDVALTTPGTLSESSTNTAAGSHTHAITASAAPGAAASLLKTTGAGGLTLTGPFAAGAGTFSGSVLIQSGGDLTVGANVLFVDVSGLNVGINTPPDPQFSLDVAGNLRARGWIVGKMALEIAGALAVFHFDGAEPYETNFTGTAFGHRGQIPTLTGGVVWRAGKFLKAVQVAAAVTNLCTNPSFETGVAGGWAGALSTTVTQTARAARVGVYSCLVEAGGGATNAKASYTMTATPATTYTLSFSVLNDDVPTGNIIEVSSFWSGGANGSAAVGTTTVANVIDVTGTDWGRYRKTFVPDFADRTGVIFYITFYGVTANGQGFFLDEIQIETGTVVTPYADGTLGTGHAWTGTAHASTSTRTVAKIRYNLPDLMQGVRGSAAVWVKLAGPWESTPYVIWGTGNSATHSTNLWSDGSGLLYFWVSSPTGGARIAYGGVSAASGWRHLVSTWDYVAGTVKLYIDGVLFATSTGAAFEITQPANIYVGSFSDGSYSANGLIDDLAFIDRVLTADEIRAIYESDAPLFAETSTWFWQTPNTLAWADAAGLWAVRDTGAAAFGVSGVNGQSWGGQTLDAGDVLIGTGAEYVKWDASAAQLAIVGELHAARGTIDGILTIGTSGEIQQGTGTIGSNYTGFRLWRDSGIGRVGGYASNVLQWYAGTDGKLYAGAGKVQLDAAGINLYGAKLFVSDDAATFVTGSLQGATTGVFNNIPNVSLRSQQAASASVELYAQRTSGGYASAGVEVVSTGAQGTTRVGTYIGGTLILNVQDNAITGEKIGVFSTEGIRTKYVTATPTGGANGDFQMGLVGGNPWLFGKVNGAWYKIQMIAA